MVPRSLPKFPRSLQSAVAINLHAMAAADLHAFNVHTAKLGLLIMIICIVQFVSSRGNEYFCEIDEDYLTDRFNLTGLNTEVSYYQYALDLVTDVFDLDADDDLREQIEKSARHLYGLVHARYIVTTRGLAKMVRSELSPKPHMIATVLTVL